MRPDRLRYDLPGERRWRLIRSLVYFLAAVSLAGLGLLAYYFINASTARREDDAGAASVPPVEVTTVFLERTATRALSPTPAARVVIATGSPTPEPGVPPTAAESATLAPTPPLPSGTPTAAATGTPTPTPLPTNTPTATASPAPTVPPPSGAGQMLFDERFDPPAYSWIGGTTAVSQAEVRAGQLSLTVSRGSLAFVVGTMPPAADFYYQAEMRPGACAAGDHYGLMVRSIDYQNFYLFGVTCEGRLRVQQAADNRYTVIVDSPPHPAVRTGEGARNVLAVRAVGPVLELYANGDLLVTLDGGRETAGRFGLYVKALSSATFNTSFDDARGWAAAP